MNIENQSLIKWKKKWHRQLNMTFSREPRDVNGRLKVKQQNTKDMQLAINKIVFYEWLGNRN